MSAIIHLQWAGICRPVQPCHSIQEDRLHNLIDLSQGTPSYFLIPRDGCGNEVQTPLGLASQANIRYGTLKVATSTPPANPTLTCSGTGTTLISVKTASSCGVDITSLVQTSCDGKTSCTYGVSACSGSTWKDQTANVAYDCYDKVAPSIESNSFIGSDSANFGFYSEMLGVYTQKRLVGTYPTDVRLNGDSIGTFTSTVTYGAASATTSTFTFTNTNLVAGNSYTVIILAKDTFGNDVLDSSTTFGVSFDKITATFTSSYIDTNRHNITFSVTEAVNTVNMLVRLGSIDLANSPKHINIIAADPTTAFISADTGLIATDSATGGITATLSLQ
eukprot:402909-Amorphochlora_amoeboformis.AAC.1